MFTLKSINDSMFNVKAATTHIHCTYAGEEPHGSVC